MSKLEMIIEYMAYDFMKIIVKIKFHMESTLDCAQGTVRTHNTIY